MAVCGLRKDGSLHADMPGVVEGMMEHGVGETAVCRNFEDPRRENTAQD